MSDLEEYIEYVCNILKMPVVASKVITSQKIKLKAGKGINAYYNRDENCIYMLKKKKYDLNDYFVLSHEIRHAWQQYTNPDYYFNDYFEEMDEDSYNSSNAEIDANAFATIAMAIGFSKIVEISYKTNPEAAEKYDQRLSELMDEFGISFE